MARGGMEKVAECMRWSRSIKRISVNLCIQVDTFKIILVFHLRGVRRPSGSLMRQRHIFQLLGNMAHKEPTWLNSSDVAFRKPILITGYRELGALIIRTSKGPG